MVTNFRAGPMHTRCVPVPRPVFLPNHPPSFLCPYLTGQDVPAESTSMRTHREFRLVAMRGTFLGMDVFRPELLGFSGAPEPIHQKLVSVIFLLVLGVGASERALAGVPSRE